MKMGVYYVLSNFNPIIVLFLTSFLTALAEFWRDFNPIIVLFLTISNCYKQLQKNNFNPIIVLFLTNT